MSGYRVGSALLVVGLFGTVAAEGQGREFPFHYAVKLVCGIQRERGGVVPQSYATTINIHNPSDSVAQFVKSWVMTLPPGGQRPMKPRRLSVDTLGPTLALATDCVDVHRRSGSGVPPFFEGFVLIDSSHSLDVVAVYSVPGGIDIVHVPERSRFR